MEMPGIEPGTFHMQSERSTAEPHPHVKHCTVYVDQIREYSADL